MDFKQVNDFEEIKMESDEDIIWITVGHYKRLLSYGKTGVDALSVYTHYMFTARLQHTNQVWAIDNYTKTGLSMGADRFKKAKELLLELNLIEEFQLKDDSGRFGKKFIKVHTSDKYVLNHRDGGFRVPDKTGVGKKTTNALKKKRNALKEKVKENKSDDLSRNDNIANFGEKEKKIISDKNNKRKNTESINSFNLEIDWKKKLNEDFSEIMELFRKHKLKGLNFRNNSKSVKNFYFLLKDIESGKLPKKEFNKAWLEKQEIDFSKFEKFSRKKLNGYFKKSLSTFAKHRSEKNDSDYQKILDNMTAMNFIYNFGSKKSFFMKMICNPPKPSKQQINELKFQKVEKKLNDLGINFNYLREKVYNNHVDVFHFVDEQKRKSLYTVNQFVNWLDEDQENLKLFGYPRTIKGFLDLVGEWHLQQNKMMPEFLSIGGPSWNWFNDWLKSQHSIDYRKLEDSSEVRAKRLQKEAAEKRKQVKKMNDFEQLVHDKMEAAQEFGIFPKREEVIQQLLKEQPDLATA